MNLRNFVLAAAFAAAWLPGQTAQAWVSKQVGDWNAECSNGLTCKMGFWDLNAKGLQYVSFQRKGAPNAPVDLRLSTAPDFSPDADPTVTYRFTVDGRELLRIAAKDLTQEEHSDVYFYSNQAKVLALLDAMENGKTADVTVTGKAGSQMLPVKLGGVKGAMLYLDEAQGRLDRVDALEAKGDKKVPRDGTAKDILTLEDMPEIVRKDFTDSGGACSDLPPERIKQFEGFDVAIGSIRLIGVPCATGGAYNQPYALYVMNEVVERISFPYMDEGKPTAMTVAMNIDFDPVTKTLTSFFRGRGIGDCGEYMKWQFDERGDRLSLLEMRNKPDCDEGDNDPTKFPLVWKAEK
jgi:hypothetical protein